MGRSSSYRIDGEQFIVAHNLATQIASLVAAMLNSTLHVYNRGEFFGFPIGLGTR